MAITIGAKRHRITLANPDAPSPTLSNGDGTYTQTYTALSPPVVSASIAARDSRTLERFFANTIEAIATHLVGIRYHSGVTTKTRITFGTRVLWVRAVRNIDERNEEQLLACEEVVS